MKMILYIVLLVSVTSCSSSGGYNYYSYESENGDTTLLLHAENIGTDSAYLVLNVSKNLYSAENISMHFCMSNIDFHHFKSRHFEPAYKADSLDIPEQYYFLFDAKKSNNQFLLDTAVTVTVRSKSGVIFQNTLNHDSRSDSWDLPVVKTCLANSGKGTE